MRTVALFIVSFQFVCTTVSNARPITSDSPNTNEAKWVLDEDRFLIGARSSYGAAMGVLDQAKKKGVFDDGLRLVSVENRDIILNVAWFVVAIGEHAVKKAAVETLLTEIERDMGEILVPPWICSPEAFRKNIDALALKHARSGVPYPDPEFRTLATVAAEARARMEQRAKVRQR